ncbi:MAG: hypothetical protein Pars92KO_13320 [Parasphingorhabdus sp.]
MHKIFLPLTLPLLAATGPANAAPNPAKCLDIVENIDFDKTDKPKMRTLDREAPAAIIAAVDRRVDNCPVLVVLDDQLAGEPRWTAPETPPIAKRLPALGR